MKRFYMVRQFLDKEEYKMSCFIMSDRSQSSLADTLEYSLNSGFNRFGFDAPDSLHKALADCRDRYGYYNSGEIFRRLYDLNNRAYNGRYKCAPGQESAIIPDKPTVPPLVEPRERVNLHEKLLPWHYKFCKMMDCLIYQCCEDATRDDPLQLALIDFSRVYKSFLVVNTDEYSSAPWGTI